MYNRQLWSFYRNKHRASSAISQQSSQCSGGGDIIWRGSLHLGWDRRHRVPEYYHHTATALLYYTVTTGTRLCWQKMYHKKYLPSCARSRVVTSSLWISWYSSVLCHLITSQMYDDYDQTYTYKQCWTRLRMNVEYNTLTWHQSALQLTLLYCTLHSNHSSPSWKICRCK